LGSFSPGLTVRHINSRVARQNTGFHTPLQGDEAILFCHECPTKCYDDV
jgi:hypothetical protein